MGYTLSFLSNYCQNEGCHFPFILSQLSALTRLSSSHRCIVFGLVFGLCKSISLPDTIAHRSHQLPHSHVFMGSNLTIPLSPPPKCLFSSIHCPKMVCFWDFKPAWYGLSTLVSTLKCCLFLCQNPFAHMWMENIKSINKTDLMMYLPLRYCLSTPYWSASAILFMCLLSTSHSTQYNWFVHCKQGNVKSNT